jgi:hypothetical protein
MVCNNFDDIRPDARGVIEWSVSPSPADDDSRDTEFVGE